MPKVKLSPTAGSIPFDTVNTENITAENLQEAVEQIDDITGINIVQLNHRGWEQVTDTQYTQSSRLNLAKNVRTLLPNNAGSIINSQIPDAVITFWNPSTSKFTPDRVGDFYSLRLSFKTTANKNNAQGTLELDIGGSQGVIWSTDVAYTKGANTIIDVTKTIPIYTLNTFIVNGGEFYFTCSESATLFDINLVVFRAYRGRD